MTIQQVVDEAMDEFKFDEEERQIGRDVRRLLSEVMGVDVGATNIPDAQIEGFRQRLRERFSAFRKLKDQEQRQKNTLN